MTGAHPAPLRPVRAAQRQALTAISKATRERVDRVRRARARVRARRVAPSHRQHAKRGFAG